MTPTPAEDRAIDLLAEAARAELPDGDADLPRMVETAMWAARARRVALRRRIAAGLAVAAAAVLALGATRLLSGSGATDLATVALPGGDRLVAAGASFEVREEAGRDRSVALERGQVLFDVSPARGARAFTVVTPHLTARVRGTVFTVSVSGERSRVRVYEGEVDVERGGGATESLGDGASFDSATEGPITEDDTVEALRREATRAATRRGLEARRVRAVASLEREAAAETEPGDEGAPGDDREAGAATATEAPVAAAGPGVEGRGRTEIPRGEAEPADDDREAAEPAGAPTLAQARAWLLAGEYDRVVAAAPVARASGGDAGAWLMLEADALRARGDGRHAATTYDRAARALSPSRATQAGYLAATLHGAAGDPAAGIASLDTSRADQPGSPLHERALALRVDLLARLGRTAEARTAARAYLLRFPSGGARERLADLVEGTP